MRHRRDHRKLSRTAAHRKALLRNLVTSLFLHERITTTIAKAKEARRLAERLITYAKRNNLHSRRLVAAVVNDREVVTKVFNEIVPLYTTREGGYTRILRTQRRLGDAGEIGILELVKSSEQKEADRKRKSEAADAAKPKKKGLFGRKKAAETEAAVADSGTAAAEIAADAKAEKSTEKSTAKSGRKPRAKAEPGSAHPRGPGATAPGKATRRTRGSQRGQ